MLTHTSKLFLGFFISLTLKGASIPPHPQKIQRAFVYDDSSLGSEKRGTSLEGIKETLASFQHYIPTSKRITPTELLSGNVLAAKDLFILPGGRDIPYTKVLNGRGNLLLQKFIREGGRFLGICAGAYYSGREVDFKPKNPLFQVTQERELALFPGKVSGPALGDRAYHPAKSLGVKAASLQLKGTKESFKIFYHAGGYFEKQALPHIKTLATYEENGENAIIKIKYGKGIVILSGVHFEYSPERIISSDSHVRKVCLELNPFEKQRQKLLKRILLELQFF